MKDERWESVRLLSELRGKYNCFDKKEEPYYRALSVAIASVSEQIYADNEKRNSSEKPTDSESEENNK